MLHLDNLYYYIDNTPIQFYFETFELYYKDNTYFTTVNANDFGTNSRDFYLSLLDYFLRYINTGFILTNTYTKFTDLNFYSISKVNNSYYWWDSSTIIADRVITNQTENYYLFNVSNFAIGGELGFIVDYLIYKEFGIYSNAYFGEPTQENTFTNATNLIWFVGSLPIYYLVQLFSFKLLGVNFYVIFFSFVAIGIILFFLFRRRL